MWNPRADADALMNDFLTGYYGPAGPYLRQYIDLETRKLTESGKAMTLYEPPVTHAGGYLSPAQLRAYTGLFDQAMAAVKDDPMRRHRVEMALQSIRYAWLEVSKYQVFSDNWIFAPAGDGRWQLKPQAAETLDLFWQTARKYGPDMVNEKFLSPDQYHTQMTNYFQNAVVNHLAVGGKITFDKPCSKKYPANGPASLIDGVRGTEDYAVLWQGWLGDDVNAVIDLRSSQSLTKIEVTCLDDSLSWIMGPRSVTVEASEDGEHYAPAAFYANPDAGKQVAKQVLRFVLPFKAPTQARYVRVKIENVGKLPAWRGVDDKAWLFVDEIVIK